MGRGNSQSSRVAKTDNHSSCDVPLCEVRNQGPARRASPSCMGPPALSAAISALWSNKSFLGSSFRVSIEGPEALGRKRFQEGL